MSHTENLAHIAARIAAFIQHSLGGDACHGGEAATRRADQQFAALALELFALQFEHCAPYRTLCEKRRIRPGSVEHWSRIPPVPAAAFKQLEMSCLPRTERTAFFQSSGTTGQQPSRHYHNAESLALYETSLRPWFQLHLLPDLAQARAAGAQALPRPDGYTVPQPCRSISLTPPLVQAPHSSLVHMFDFVVRTFGAGDGLFLGRVEADGGWQLDLELANETLRDEVSRGRPVLLLGTAFLFVHLLEHLAANQVRLTLAPGSRVLETGGYKGRSRALAKPDLYKLITDVLGVPRRQIVCEYGMSELSSQAYDHVAGVSDAEPVKRGQARAFRFPPWARATVVSPETGGEAAEGQIGLLRVFDLANVYAVMSVQTEDLAVRRQDGFELLGREALAEPRGCSLMAN